MRETTRCRKHCLHQATPQCLICCHCGRGVNRAGMPWPIQYRGWEDRSAHGDYLVAPTLRTVSRPGYTTGLYRGHPIEPVPATTTYTA